MPQELRRLVSRTALFARRAATSIVVAQCTPGRFIAERDKFDFCVSHSASATGSSAQR